MYVIQHIETGKFVAPAGSKKTYTEDILKAQWFYTQNGANENLCVESERVVRVRDLIPPMK